MRHWTACSIEHYDAIVLPKTFEELDQIPFNQPYNFLMSLDRNSIDKEVVRLGVEVHMFWELPKVKDALNELCKNGSLMIAKPTAKTPLISLRTLRPLVLLTKFLHHHRLQLLVPKRKKNNVLDWVCRETA